MLTYKLVILLLMKATVSYVFSSNALGGNTTKVFGLIENVNITSGAYYSNFNETGKKKHNS